jgi:hypothetical protein
LYSVSICSFTQTVKLYVFFWVIPWHLNFICRHFGTLCLFYLHRHVGAEQLNLRIVGVSIWEKVWLENSLNQTFSRMATPTILKFSHSTPTCLWRWNSVPKRRHIKFRRRGITQKKTYNIQNMVKVWNQETVKCIHNYNFQHWFHLFLMSPYAFKSYYVMEIWV